MANAVRKSNYMHSVKFKIKEIIKMGTGLTGVLLCAGITVALAVACILIGKGLSLVTDKMLPDNK